MLFYNHRKSCPSFFKTLAKGPSHMLNKLASIVRAVAVGLKNALVMDEPRHMTDAEAVDQLLAEQAQKRADMRRN